MMKPGLADSQINEALKRVKVALSIQELYRVIGVSLTTFYNQNV